LRRNYIFLKNKNVGILWTALLFALSTVDHAINYYSEDTRIIHIEKAKN
jgi:hypothetical protein